MALAGMEVPSFLDAVRDKPFTRGIGFYGWLGFELTTNSKNLEGTIMHKVRLVDALGESHQVVRIGEPQPEEWVLQHNVKLIMSKV